MVRWTRSGRARAGKMAQAVQWAKEIADYVTRKSGVSVTAYVDAFGEFGTIRWFADYADLETIEKIRNQLMADKEYVQKLGPYPELLSKEVSTTR